MEDGNVDKKGQKSSKSPKEDVVSPTIVDIAVEERRRVDYEVNHALIRDAYVQLIGRLKRKPTLREVSQITGISIEKISEHLRAMKFEASTHPLRVLTDDVLMSIYLSARKGSSRSQELWMQLMEGWKPTGNIDVNKLDIGKIEVEIIHTKHK